MGLSTLTGSNEAPMLRFETSLGNFTVELFEKEAPISVKNFLRYAGTAGGTL